VCSSDLWSDEFNGTSLDTVNAWTNDTSPVYGADQADYHRECVTVENGNLVIWTKHNAYGYDYPSGRINTHDKKIFTYGYFECRMITPVGQVSGSGLWSDVWLLGNSINHGVSWPTCGEMVLYDQRPGNIPIGAFTPQPVPATIGDNEFIACCHYAGADGMPSYHQLQYNYSTCLCDGYHKFALLWDSTHVEYYFDDSLYWGPNYPTVNGTNFGTPSINQATNWNAFHSPMYWIINVMVGGNYQGQKIDNAIFPTKMLIDYVRVYQKSTGVVNSDIRRQRTLRSFALVNPATARLAVYDLSGKLVADYSGRVRRMKTGDNAMKCMPSTLSNGAYVVTLVDNGVSASRMLGTAK
jgi:beta-glucanase (GH16 family)